MRDLPKLDDGRTWGKDLRVGDTIAVWWSPRRDTIVALRPYHGPLAHIFPHGAQIATFAILPSGDMTIDNGDVYEVIARAPKS